MLTLGSLGFAAPWLLTALVALPVLWLILRAIPPAPKVIRFPGTALLAGLTDRTPVSARTPWWLLLLRCAAAALLIIGFAGPVWQPAAQGGTGPLLLVVDAGWAAAPDWQARLDRARAALSNAADRPAAVLIADGRPTGALPFEDAAAAERTLRAALPASWPTRYPADIAATLANAPVGLETLWLSDGLDHPGRAEWLAELTRRGEVRVAAPSSFTASLTFASSEPPSLTLQRTGAGAGSVPPAILALGPDPQGVPRVLARLTPGAASSAAGVVTNPVPLELPAELRNRVSRFEVEGLASAGTTWLADERTRRRKVALVGPGVASEGQALLTGLHYLRQAMSPRSDIIEGSIADVLQAAPDVIVLSDVLLRPTDQALIDWVEGGGTLIRFAGPRMAGAETLIEDPLLPLRLRQGGRDIGGALSWGDPRGLSPLPGDGPFAGLIAPPEVAVRAQLMAEPGPDVAGATLAALTDGTPVVTRAERGQGQVVLFHITANAEWSDLPLSGLFVEMLNRLVQSSRSAGAASAAGAAAGAAPAAATPATAELFWTPQTLLDGFGREAPAGTELSPVADSDLATAPVPGIAAGLYRAERRERAVNAGTALTPAIWPEGVALEEAARRASLGLEGWALALAMLLMAADAVASAILARGRRTGRFGFGRRAPA